MSFEICNSYFFCGPICADFNNKKTMKHALHACKQYHIHKMPKWLVHPTVIISLNSEIKFHTRSISYFIQIKCMKMYKQFFYFQHQYEMYGSLLATVIMTAWRNNIFGFEWDFVYLRAIVLCIPKQQILLFM